MPAMVDVAYELNVNLWKGEKRLQLTLKALREHQSDTRINRGRRQYNVKSDIHYDNEISFNLFNDASNVLKARWSNQAGVISSDAHANHPEVKRLLWEAALSLGLTP